MATDPSLALSPAPGRSPLIGRRLLVLEDEVLIALDVATTIEEAGGTAVIAHDADAAHRALDAAGGNGGIACAVLDVDLAGHTSEGVVRRLHGEGSPFVFYTASLGHLRAADEAMGAPVITKPASPEKLIAAIVEVLRRQGHPASDPGRPG